MGEIVNLRTRRRRQERDHAAAEAADNRARFGRTRGEKLRDALEANRRESGLDGSRLDPPAADVPAIEE